MKIDGLRVPGGFAGTYHSGTLTIEDREFSKCNGYFWFCLDMGKSSARLDPNQARQLRDEITAFLGETESPHLICDHKNLCTHARWYKKEADVALRASNDLHDANEALRRDNADLTRQKDRLLAENIRLSTEKANLNAAINYSQQSAQQLKDKNEKLRERYDQAFKKLHDDFWSTKTENETLKDKLAATLNLNAENEKLRQRVASLEKDNADLHLDVAAHEVEYNHMRDITEGFIDNAKGLLTYFGHPTSAH